MGGSDGSSFTIAERVLYKKDKSGRLRFSGLCHGKGTSMLPFIVLCLNITKGT